MHLIARHRLPWMHCRTSAVPVKCQSTTQQSFHDEIFTLMQQMASSNGICGGKMMSNVQTPRFMMSDIHRCAGT